MLDWKKPAANDCCIREKSEIRVRPASGKPFPGQYFDSETGLHYNYFRDYDPATGRYIESDPIGLDGGLNTYGYVGGKPTMSFDVYGLAEYCRRPVNGKPGDKLNYVQNHHYLCVPSSDGVNGYVCSSTTPTGSIYGSKGRATSAVEDDYYDFMACVNVDVRDSRWNDLVNDCLEDEFSKERPYFSILPNGTDCQEWSEDTLNKCRDQVQKYIQDNWYNKPCYTCPNYVDPYATPWPPNPKGWPDFQ